MSHVCRQLAAGDQLRVIYDNLSKDPNSLANLDQDLPNYAQHQARTPTCVVRRVVIGMRPDSLGPGVMDSSPPHSTSVCGSIGYRVRPKHGTSEFGSGVIGAHTAVLLTDLVPPRVQVRIFSLPQEWLWCETWCGNTTKHRAKTIDLCNNPLTKVRTEQTARRPHQR